MDNFVVIDRYFENQSDQIGSLISFLHAYRKNSLETWTDTELIQGSIILLIIFAYIYKSVTKWLQITQQRGYLRLLLKIPLLRQILKKEIAKTVDDFKNGLPKCDNDPMTNIPKKGWSKTDIIRRLDEHAQVEHQAVNSGKYSGVVFTDDQEIENLAGEAAKRFLYTNMLYYKKFAPSRQMECELISFTKNLLNGDSKTTGMTTNGGSESIFLGILAHKRYYFREHGITEPEVIMAESAHPAFIKACEFTGVKAVRIPCNRKTGMVKGSDYEARINKNTICCVCSSPNLPYGTIDPISEVSVLAGKYKVGLFIDGCMGSQLLPFVDACGVRTGEKYVDLRNKNVTCMSCDTHKYGLSPKGISVLLFPDVEIKKSLYFGITDWVGGLYGTHSIQGSRPAFTIAAAWSVMMKLGYNGYFENAKEVFRATDYVVEEVGKLNQFVKIIGNPKLGNVTIMSNNKKVNMFDIGTLMERRGWMLGAGQGIPTLTCTIHPRNASKMKSLIEDLKGSLKELEQGADLTNQGGFKIYGELKGVPSFITSAIVAESIEGLFEIDGLFKPNKNN